MKAYTIILQIRKGLPHEQAHHCRRGTSMNTKAYTIQQSTINPANWVVYNNLTQRIVSDAMSESDARVLADANNVHIWNGQMEDHQS